MTKIAAVENNHCDRSEFCRFMPAYCFTSTDVLSSLLVDELNSELGSTAYADLLSSSSLNFRILWLVYVCVCACGNRYRWFPSESHRVGGFGQPPANRRRQGGDDRGGAHRWGEGQMLGN